MKPSRYNRLLGLVPLVAGLVLFAGLVRAVGPATIADRVAQFGPAFLLLLAASGARHVVRASAWSLCLRETGARAGFLDLLAMHLAGEALTDLTFAGPVLGGTTKAIALSKRVPKEHAIASVLTEHML